MKKAFRHGRLDFKIEALRDLLAAQQFQAVRIICGIGSEARGGMWPHIEAAIETAALAAVAQREAAAKRKE